MHSAFQFRFGFFSLLLLFVYPPLRSNEIDTNVTFFAYTRLDGTSRTDRYTLLCMSPTSSLPLKCVIIIIYATNRYGHFWQTHTQRRQPSHVRVHVSVCVRVFVIFYKFEKAAKKNDWKCFISMACHYILFEKTKSKVLGENGRNAVEERRKKKPRTRENKANKTCIERIGPYNVMLCRKFIFNRLCTRTDTIIIIII